MDTNCKAMTPTGTLKAPSTYKHHKQFNPLFHSNLWKTHKARKHCKWRTTGNATSSKKKRKENWSITHLVSFAESANKCRLTCFRTKSDSLNTADPWKLMWNRGVLFLLEGSRKEMQNKARSDRQMAIQAMLQVQERSGDTLTNKIHSLT